MVYRAFQVEAGDEDQGGFPRALGCFVASAAIPLANNMTFEVHLQPADNEPYVSRSCSGKSPITRLGECWRAPPSPTVIQLQPGEYICRSFHVEAPHRSNRTSGWLTRTHAPPLSQDRRELDITGIFAAHACARNGGASRTSARRRSYRSTMLVLDGVYVGEAASVLCKDSPTPMRSEP